LYYELFFKGIIGLIIIYINTVNLIIMPVDLKTFKRKESFNFINIFRFASLKSK